MASKEKTTNSLTISLTLPVACNICLGKVKEPVTCRNQHVFCSVCIDEWTKVHDHCPNCRVVITRENGCRRLIGAGGEESGEDCSQTERAELRRTRLDLICREYEHDISQLEEELNNVRSTNSRLEQELCRINEQQAQASCSHSTDFDHCYAVRKTEDEKSSDIDLSKLLEVTEQLQIMTRLYEKLQKSMRKLEEENKRLNNENFALRSEIARKGRANSLRDMTVSPRRVSRYTISALEAELDRRQQREEQLTRALTRSDQYTEQLERDFALVRQDCQTPCRSKQLDHNTATDNFLVANERLKFVISENSGMSCESIDAAQAVVHLKQEDQTDMPLMSHEILPVADTVSSPLLDSLIYPYPEAAVSTLSVNPASPFVMPLMDADRCDALSLRTQRRQTTSQTYNQQSSHSSSDQGRSCYQGNMESHFPVRRRSFRLGSVGSFSSAIGDLSRSTTGTIDGNGAKTLKWTL